MIKQYFKSEKSMYVFLLLYTDGNLRSNALSITIDLYEDKDKANEWYNNILKKLDTDEQVPQAGMAIIELTIIYNRILQCFVG